MKRTRRELGLDSGWELEIGLSIRIDRLGGYLYGYDGGAGHDLHTRMGMPIFLRPFVSEADVLQDVSH